MQGHIRMAALVAASLITGTTGTWAQGYYDRFGNPVGWERSGPAYDAAPPPVMYYPAPGGWYGSLNGANHPVPSSTQGDVGPEGNNNGTLTGVYVYSRW